MSDINYIPFVIDETPYCIWRSELDRRNLEFIQQIDPQYFDYIAKTHAAFLDENEQQHAAISLRTEYYHSLETLFALICATVQAPTCIFGWLLKYQYRELHSVVQKIHEGKPVMSRLNADIVSWDSIASTINIFKSEDANTDKEFQMSFGKLWHRFATDFLNDTIISEYNSIKHGMRVKAGGFALPFIIKANVDDPKSSEVTRQVGGNTFGSSFYISTILPSGKDKKANFIVDHVSLNWHPENLIHALHLVSMSINNVISYLKLQYGVAPHEAEFVVPTDASYFDKPWAVVGSMNSFITNTRFEECEREPLSKQEILDSYKS